MKFTLIAIVVGLGSLSVFALEDKKNAFIEKHNRFIEKSVKNYKQESLDLTKGFIKILNLGNVETEKEIKDEGVDYLTLTDLNYDCASFHNTLITVYDDYSEFGYSEEGLRLVCYNSEGKQTINDVIAYTELRIKLIE